MPFAAEGARCDGKQLNLVESKGRTRVDFKDRLSNTLVIGPADPDRKIPWTKPEDFKLGNKFAGLGNKDGFPLPYKKGIDEAGLFLRGDGMVLAIRGAIDNDRFRSLLTISGGEGFDSAELPCVELPEHPTFVQELAPALHIETKDDGTLAAPLVMELAEKPAGSPRRKPARPTGKPTVRQCNQKCLRAFASEVSSQTAPAASIAASACVSSSSG